jgi:hypothetical protein
VKNKLNLIVGGGKYGCEAIELLKDKQEHFLVVDTNPDCLAVQTFDLKTSADLTLNQDSFVLGDLSKSITLIEQLKPEYVFPTAPVHIVADMAKIKFKLSPWPEAADSILSRLPPIVVLLAGKGKIILSFNRDNDCVDHCAMPEVCPSSKITKPCTMTKLMKFASPDAYILISYSMAPGLGALKGQELLDFFSWAENRACFVVGTACDCHGVFSAFRKA